MTEKVTDLMLNRIKELVKAIENGEYEPNGYTFTIKLFNLTGKEVIISDCSYKNEQH